MEKEQPFSSNTLKDIHSKLYPYGLINWVKSIYALINFKKNNTFSSTVLVKSLLIHSSS